MDRLEKVVPALRPVSEDYSVVLEQTWTKCFPTLPQRSTIEHLHTTTGIDVKVIYYWFQCRLYLPHIINVLDDCLERQNTTVQFPELDKFHLLVQFYVPESAFYQQQFAQDLSWGNDMLPPAPPLSEQQLHQQPEQQQILDSLDHLIKPRKSHHRRLNKARIDLWYPPLLPPVPSIGSDAEEEEDKDGDYIDEVLDLGQDTLLTPSVSVTTNQVLSTLSISNTVTVTSEGDTFFDSLESTSPSNGKGSDADFWDSPAPTQTLLIEPTPVDEKKPLAKTHINSRKINPRTRRTKLRGQVKFEYPKDADAALKVMHTLDGQKAIKVPGPERLESSSSALTKILIRGLARTVDKDELVDFVSQFGLVLDVYLPPLHKCTVGMSSPTSFGIVEFESEHEAERALESRNLSLHGQLVDIRPFDDGGGSFKARRFQEAKSKKTVLREEMGRIATINSFNFD
ncbi:hypothetical protein BGZ83_002161 [Gryganskiella cystojenkinii]|nr:hypothetical protein BGZ83_002161 [Gryganskiella cystojenkinii]